MTPPRKRGGFSANARANAPRWLPKAPSKPHASATGGVSKQTPNNFYAGRDFGPATQEVILLSKDGLPPVDGTPTAIEAGRHWEVYHTLVETMFPESAPCAATPFTRQLKQAVPWSDI